MKTKTKNKNKNVKANKSETVAQMMTQTRGRYMSLMIENSKSSEVISCKYMANKDKTVVVQDRNNGNRKRVIAKTSLKGMHCGADLYA